MQNDSAIQNALAALQEAFKTELPQRLERLCEALHRLLAEDCAGPGARADAIHHAHGLVGAGGTFGFQEISIAAAALEQALLDLPEHADITPMSREAIRAAETALRHASPKTSA